MRLRIYPRLVRVSQRRASWRAAQAGRKCCFAPITIIIIAINYDDNHYYYYYYYYDDYCCDYYYYYYYLLFLLLSRLAEVLGSASGGASGAASFGMFPKAYIHYMCIYIYIYIYIHTHSYTYTCRCTCMRARCDLRPALVKYVMPVLACSPRLPKQIDK